MLHVLNSLIHWHRQQFNSHPQSQDSGPQALLQMLVPLVGLASVQACLLQRWPCMNKFQQATSKAWTKAYRDYCEMTTDSDSIYIQYVHCTLLFPATWQLSRLQLEKDFLSSLIINGITSDLQITSTIGFTKKISMNLRSSSQLQSWSNFSTCVTSMIKSLSIRQQIVHACALELHLRHAASCQKKNLC